MFGGENFAPLSSGRLGSCLDAPDANTIPMLLTDRASNTAEGCGRLTTCLILAVFEGVIAGVTRTMRRCEVLNAVVAVVTVEMVNL
jgi:hypothetical protein